MDIAKVIMVQVVIAVVGSLVAFVGLPEFEPQDNIVMEQYQQETDEQYGIVNVFLLYYNDKDTIDIDTELKWFKSKYPKYIIVDYEKTIRVREERTYEVLIIYAKKEDDSE